MQRLRVVALILVVVVSLSVASVNPLKALAVQGQHLVRPGETLYCIGRGYGVAPWAIAQANGLSVLAGLSVGQSLSIPAVPWASMPPGPVCAPQFTPDGSAPILTAAPPEATVVTGSVYHLVQRGDSLWRIGRLYSVTVAALMSANNLQSSLIFVGQQLLIPGTVAAAPPSPTLPAPTGGENPAPAPTQPAQPTEAPPQPSPTSPPPNPTDPAPLPTETPAVPTSTVPAPTATPLVPTNTALPVPSATTAPVGDPLACDVSNIAWSQSGQLLRGGRPEGAAFACLAAAGVDVLIDQRTPAEAGAGYAGQAQQAGLEYINLGIPDDTAPSPATLAAWISTVDARLGQGQIVLVHDAAGRGRMGFWDAVYFMLHGASAQSAIEDRYLAKALPFDGAKIGCGDGGNGQVQALAEIAQLLTGTAYVPTVDEYGTAWANCARPSYMDGWDFGPLFGP